MSTKTPAPPGGLRPAGRRLWSSVVDRFDLDQAEQDLLEQACRTRDRLDSLERIVNREGLIVVGGRVHPALTEARQQAVVFARLVAALRFPDEEDRRPPRRSSRGVYQIAQKARQRAIGAQRERLRLHDGGGP